MKEKYLADRKILMDEAQVLINDGKMEDFEVKTKEVEALDSKFEAACLAQANLNAMQDKAKITDIQNKNVKIEGGKILATITENKVLDENEVYVGAWANFMQGRKLEGNEQEIFNKVNSAFNNAYTHDTGNTAVLIPTTVAAGIFKVAEEMYPLYADARKFEVTGKLSIKKHTAITAGDAAWYAEATPTADEANTFGELVLDGCELSKSVTVSWKLKAMAMAEFIPYIILELGERCGVALGVAAASGAGATATPPQPQGVETALIAEVGTPQVITYDPDNAVPVPLTYAKITAAIGKIGSSYLAGCKIYAKNATIWGQLSNLLDVNGRPLFIPDVTSGGVGRMFGMVVEADAGITGMNILIGNAGKGLVFNTNEPLSIVTEDHAKLRETDYVAYGVVDGGVMDTKAFALIQEVVAG